MSIPLKQWLQIATPEQTKRLAKAAKSSVKTIQNVARGFRRGSADFAVRLLRASQHVQREKADNLPLVDMASVCPSCRKCPFYLSRKADEQGN